MIISYTVFEVWCVTDVIVLSHFGLLLHFYPPNNPKKENFNKMEKTLGDIIILHKHIKNDDHMPYCS